jgi:small subunit ribosomal protein S17
VTQATAGRKARKERVGVVVSDRMSKTVVVRVETRRRHPFYGKTMRHTKTYKAHDEGNASHIGDTVVIADTRPLSKDKRWRVVRVLARRAVEPLPAGPAAGGAEAKGDERG